MKKEINHYWSGRAKSYSEQNKQELMTNSVEKWKAVIFEYIDKNKKIKVLDIGTGPGVFAILLAKEGYAVTAVDQNQNMVRYAIENARREDVEIELYHIDGELPFEDETFDLIISRNVVWMQLEPEKTLASWFRILKTGGQILYFDAEWYAYLRDEEDTKQYHSFEEKVNQTAGELYHKTNEMEKLAVSLPLTYQARPGWDLRFWESMGAQKIQLETNINDKVYTEIEKIRYAKTPEFLVCAMK